jgi:hypothetical protein
MANVASDALFVLIKSLSKSEKRYFRLQPMAEDGQHRLLFDAMEKLSTYDEEKILKLLKGSPMVDALSIAKNRLYHTLLKSLASFHHKATARAEVMRLLQSIEVLYNRGLHEQADKLVNSALKIARKNELSALHLELNEWKERILEAMTVPANERYELLNNNYTDTQAIVSSIQNEKEIACMKWSWFAGYYTNGQARESSEQENNERLLAEIKAKHGISLEAQIKLLQLKGAVLLNAGKPKESLQSLMELFDVLKNNEWKNIQDKSVLRSALANASVISTQLNNVKDATSYLSQLESCFEENENKSLLHSTALTVFLLQKNSQAAHEYIQQHKEILSVPEGEFDNRMAHVWFQSAVVCFIQQEFKESERFIQKLLQHIPASELVHLQCIAQVFNLILHIELNNERYIPYALRNVQRFLVTRNKAFEGEKKILQFINETLKKRKSIDEKEIWNWLEKELLDVKKSDPLFFTYFDFHKWAKARATKTDFASVVFE